VVDINFKQTQLTTLTLYTDKVEQHNKILW